MAAREMGLEVVDEHPWHVSELGVIHWRADQLVDHE